MKPLKKSKEPEIVKQEEIIENRILVKLDDENLFSRVVINAIAISIREAIKAYEEGKLNTKSVSFDDEKELYQLNHAMGYLEKSYNSIESLLILQDNSRLHVDMDDHGTLMLSITIAQYSGVWSVLKDYLNPVAKSVMVDPVEDDITLPSKEGTTLKEEEIDLLIK